MHATITATSGKGKLAEEITHCLTKHAIPRALLLHNCMMANEKLTVRIEGRKVDICALVNAIASSFPQAQVTLEWDTPYDLPFGQEKSES